MEHPISAEARTFAEQDEPRLEGPEWAARIEAAASKIHRREQLETQATYQKPLG